MEGLISAIQHLEASDTELATPAQVAPKRNRKAIKPPPMALFRPIAVRKSYIFKCTVDTAEEMAFVLGNGETSIQVHAQAQNDRTLVQDLKAGASATHNEFLFESDFQRSGLVWQTVEAAAFDQLAWLYQAASKDVTRYNLNGVFFGAGKYQGRWCATDGHRLHELSGMPDFFNRGTIVHISAIKAICAALKWCKPEAVSVAESQFMTHWKMEAQGMHVHIVARKVDGQFPDYAQVFPNTLGTPNFKGNGKSLEKCLALAPKRGTDKAKSIMLVDSSESSGLFARPLEGADFSLPVYNRGEIPEKRFSVALNASYLLEALSDLSEEVAIWPMSGLDPVVIWPDDRRRALIMPIIK